MRHEVKDWLVSGDYASLQAFLDGLDTRVYALERGRVGAQTQVAQACLQVLVERFTVVTMFDNHRQDEAARAYAGAQLQRVAAGICKLYGLDPPAWVLAEQMKGFGDPKGAAEHGDNLDQAAKDHGGGEVLDGPDDKAEDH